MHFGCVPFFYGFYEKENTALNRIICACDKHTEASIQNGQTAAASGPDENHKGFSSGKIFGLISPERRDGETRIRCWAEAHLQVFDWNYYVDMDIYVISWIIKMCTWILTL